MLKARLGAYDGKGNFRVGSAEEVPEAFSAMSNALTGGCYAEAWVGYTTELAVMVLNSQEENCVRSRCFPVVDFKSVNSILLSTRCPAMVPEPVRRRAQEVALLAIEALPQYSYGVFGVELFALPDGRVFLNEIAPRPHNSGHYTIEGCGTSQFKAHLLGVLSGLPEYQSYEYRVSTSSLDLSLRVGAATMINMVEGKGFPPGVFSLNSSLGATMHWYGKAEQRVGRKMAHVTICASNHGVLQQSIEASCSEVAQISYDTGTPAVVGVIMGSDSDLPCMIKAVDVLLHFEIPYGVTIVSAHRTPERMSKYAKEAQGRGLKVIIAGAGGAAHLPGMVAAMTPLPVVGVPVKTSTLSGVDSLYSIVQMPRGVPVATVAIGNAKNAALLAARIVAASTGDTDLSQKLEAFRRDAENEVKAKAQQLEDMGPYDYARERNLVNKTVM